MEAGAGYGEKGQNIAAQDPTQGGIPLPKGGYQVTQTPDGTVAAARPTEPSAAPLDVAQQWIPDVTPLTAPDDRPDLGLLAGSPPPGPRAATLISRMSLVKILPRLASEAFLRASIDGPLPMTLLPG